MKKPNKFQYTDDDKVIIRKARVQRRKARRTQKAVYGNVTKFI